MEIKKEFEFDLYMFLSRILVGLTFGCGVYFLISPWLEFIEFQLGIFKFIWFIGVIALSFTLAHLVEKEKLERGILIVLSFIAVNYLLLYMIGWDFIYYSILFLILLLLGLRAWMYENKVDFNTDLGISIIFLIFTIFQSTNYDVIEISFFNIFFVFICGVSLSLYFNNNLVIQKNRNRLIIRVLAPFIVLMSTFHFLMKYSEPFFTKAMSVISFVYLKLVDLLVFIITPIVRLIFPLLNLLWNIILKILLFINRFGKKTEMEEAQREAPNYQEMIEQMDATAKEFNYPYWIFYIVLGLILLIVIYKLYQEYGESDEEGYTEERESIFTFKDLINDLNILWNKVKSPLEGRGNKSIYDGSSNILRIREIYYNFLNYYSNIGQKHRSDTPNQYLRFLIASRRSEGKKSYFRELTKLYNKARYKEEVDEEEVERAQGAWNKIRDKDKEKGEG